MTDKIIVEFDREELRNKCKTMQHYPHNCCLPDCRKEDKDLIGCVINGDLSCFEYKIKEQNNEKKIFNNKS